LGEIVDWGLGIEIEIEVGDWGLILWSRSGLDLVLILIKFLILKSPCFLINYLFLIN
jgi:hypothetical protein